MMMCLCEFCSSSSIKTAGRITREPRGEDAARFHGPTSPCCGSTRLRRSNLFEAHAARTEGDEARRNVAHNRNLCEQSKLPGHVGSLWGIQSAGDDASLQERLCRLNDAGRPLALALDLREVGIGKAAGF